MGADCDARMKPGCSSLRRNENNKKQHLNPFLTPDVRSGDETRSSEEVYTNRNPFEIESDLDLDRLNPFVGETERSSTVQETGDNIRSSDISTRDSENSFEEEITLSNNNDSYEVRQFHLIFYYFIINHCRTMRA